MNILRSENDRYIYIEREREESEVQINFQKIGDILGFKKKKWLSCISH